MIDHVGLEVADLGRSAAFYDAVLGRLGARRLVDGPGAIGYGSAEPRLWIVARGHPPAPGFGHVALSASGRAAVDAATPPAWPRAAPTPAHRGRGRPTARATTPPTSWTRTGCGWRS
jgi:catechol 2,3-dioxygenase-like lactoylglutathione lyase family enzyme